MTPLLAEQLEIIKQRQTKIYESPENLYKL
jgi:hypothetical protein